MEWMYYFSSGDPLCADDLDDPFHLWTVSIFLSICSPYCPVEPNGKKRIYVWQVKKQGAPLQSASPHLHRENPSKRTAARSTAAALCHLPSRAAPASALPCS